MQHLMQPSVHTERFSGSRPGQKAVHGRVPDVIVNAVADAIELAHVGGDGGVPADLQMRTAPVKLIKADIPNDSVLVSIQPQRAGTLANRCNTPSLLEEAHCTVLTQQRQ